MQRDPLLFVMKFGSNLALTKYEKRNKQIFFLFAGIDIDEYLDDSLSCRVEISDGDSLGYTEGRDKYEEFDDKVDNIYLNIFSSRFQLHHLFHHSNFFCQIYLGAGKAVDIAVWEFIKKKKIGTFISEVSILLWGKRTLVNRCFDSEKIQIQLEGRSPRKRLDKARHAVLKGAKFFKSTVESSYNISS